MIKKERTYTLVTGQSGTGKSHLVKNYIIPQLATKKPVFVFDLLNEYVEPARKNGWNYFADFKEFLNSIPETGKLKKGVYVIAWKTDQTIISAIHFFRALEKPVSLVFEEMHSLFSNSALKKAVGVKLQELTFYGRHYGIDCILITQRPKSLSTDIRSQIPTCFSFRQTLSSDIEAIEEISDKAGKAVIDLPEYHFYSVGEIPNVFKKIKPNKIQKI